MVVEPIFDVIKVEKCNGYQRLGVRLHKDIKRFDEFVLFDNIKIHNIRYYSQHCDSNGQLELDDNLQYKTVKINKIWSYGQYFNCLYSGMTGIIDCNCTKADLSNLVLFKKVPDGYQKIKEEMYQSFVFTLDLCGKFLLNVRDDVIKEFLFEDFDIGLKKYFFEDNLEMFLDEGWIKEEIKAKCMKLQSLFIDVKINHPQIWNVQAVRTSRLWREILDLADEINSLIFTIST